MTQAWLFYNVHTGLPNAHVERLWATVSHHRDLCLEKAVKQQHLFHVKQFWEPGRIRLERINTPTLNERAP